MNVPLYLLAVAPDWLISWGTPLWLISLGVALGLIALLILWGFTAVIQRTAAAEAGRTLVEGVMLPIVIILAIVGCLSIPGAFAVREPLEMLTSIARLPLLGEQTIQAEVPPNAERHPILVGVRGDELIEFKMSSDELVSVDDALEPGGPTTIDRELGPGVGEYSWTKRGQQPLFAGMQVDQLYVTNFSDRSANVSLQLTTGPPYPEVRAVPITAICVMVVVLLYLLQSVAVPRVSAIALATAKSELAQPLFGILVALGTFLLILFLFLPYNTFGEDIKMLKDSGLTLIMIMGIIQGVWAASNSVSEEIEGRTALTVLSKPVGRRQFIFGKVLGILWTVFLLFLILGIVFIVVVGYKPVYDAREMGSETPEWTLSHLEVMLTVPGLVLAFFEATVLVCLSVAISTRLPMLANFVICFSIYVLGHITPLIVQSRIQFAPVKFIGQFIATILPVLDHFNIQAAVAAGRPVPMSYLGWAFVYCLLYSGIALLLALALFEDRDLA